MYHMGLLASTPRQVPVPFTLGYRIYLEHLTSQEKQMTKLCVHVF